MLAFQALGQLKDDVLITPIGLSLMDEGDISHERLFGITFYLTLQVALRWD